MGSICLARTKIPDPQGFHIKHIARTVRQSELFLSGKGGNRGENKVPKGPLRTPGKPRFLT